MANEAIDVPCEIDHGVRAWDARTGRLRVEHSLDARFSLEPSQKRPLVVRPYGEHTTIAFEGRVVEVPLPPPHDCSPTLPELLGCFELPNGDLSCCGNAPHDRGAEPGPRSVWVHEFENSQSPFRTPDLECECWMFPVENVASEERMPVCCADEPPSRIRKLVYLAVRGTPHLL